MASSSSTYIILGNTNRNVKVMSFNNQIKLAQFQILFESSYSFILQIVLIALCT